MSEPLPLWIVTGFLGSGKTTLIRSLIRRPEFGRLAVVINEFGEVGLDHDIVEASSDDVYMLAGGCLCCMVRGDLSETLADLVARREVGELPKFDGVIVETSGLADPGPVVDMILGMSPLKEFYRLKSVVTVVDATNARRDLLEEAVAAAQAKAADLLVVTKTDLAPRFAVEALPAALREVAPEASVRILDRGEVDRDLIDDLVRGRLGPRDRTAGSIRAAEHDLSRIEAHPIVLDTPLDEQGLGACIAFLKSVAGPKLMRAKALVILPNPKRSIVLQAVRDTVYPPMPLGALPHEDARSRMVLITRDMDGHAIEDLLIAHRLAFVSAGRPLELVEKKEESDAAGR